jgi:hypothetical protein
MRLQKNIPMMPAAKAGLGAAMLLVLAGGWLLAWTPVPTLAQTDAEQWHTVVDSPEGMDLTVDIATIVNAFGHSLQIYRDPNDIVRGILTLKESFDRFDEASCPSIRIDGRRPRALVNLDGPCNVEGNKAHFTLGVIDEGRMESRLVFQLMNGGDISFWYHVKDVGYRESVFTLRNSLQALTVALGTEVQIFTP